jgi:hypothetical protein
MRTISKLPAVSNTITGQMIDIEELTEQELDPPVRESGNLDTLTTQNKSAAGHGRQEVN